MTAVAIRPTVPPSSRGRLLAIASVVAGATFVGVLVLAGRLDPGYSQLAEPISALASTESRSAPVMIAGFGCLGGAAVAAGAALLHSLRGGLARAAAVLVVMAGLATWADGYLRQSCSGLERSCLDREASGDVSRAHVLHNLIALPLFTMLLVAAFLLAFALRRTPRLRHLWFATLVGAGLVLVFFVWFGSSAFGSYGGLVQRVLLGLAYGIPMMIGWAATRPGGQAEPVLRSHAARVNRY